MSFVQVPPDSTGKLIATNEIGGEQYQLVTLADSTGAEVTPLTNTQLRASALSVTGPLTNAQLRAAPLDISGTITDGATSSGQMLLVGGQTAAGVAQVFETNASGHLNISDGGGSITVDGPITDAQLRASAVPVSLSSAPLPTGAATETTLAALNTKTPSLGQATMANSQPVAIASDQAAIPVATNGVTATGTMAALNASVVLNVLGFAGVAFDIRGTFSATVTFQGTIDGTTWFSLIGMPVASVQNAQAISTATAAGAWFFNCAGCTQVRAIATAYTSGTITATARAVTSTPWVYQAAVGASSAMTLASGTVTTVSTVTASNGNFPQTIADVASAALTTTTTTAAFTPTFGISYSVVVPVTAVSGTTPTLDIGVEESDDSGTNWYRVYDFPRITATGIFRSPPLTMRGNRVRYVQTVGGTTPSFTRSISRLQRSDDAPIRTQFLDRTIVLNTLNSTTPSYIIEGCTDLAVIIRTTAFGSAATVTFQLSQDGANWFTHSTIISITAAGIFRQSYANEIGWRFARLNVSSAGSGITLDVATIAGVGR